MATAPDWIWIVALGALMGAVGQGIRVIVGLKKTSDEAAAAGHKLSDKMDPARLSVSLLIGAVAGVMAAIATLGPGVAIKRDALLALAAAGYSGADFVEGFMARYLPSGRVQPPLAFAAAEVLSSGPGSSPGIAAAAVVAQPTPAIGKA
jgi:hypothetical protein